MQVKHFLIGLYVLPDNLNLEPCLFINVLLTSPEDPHSLLLTHVYQTRVQGLHSLEV